MIGVFLWRVSIMGSKNISYTAASTLPVKLIIDKGLTQSIKSHNIYPTHIQINPSNRCNFNCSFCSLSNRDKEIELDWDRMKETVYKFYKLGTKAATITGGGDPLMYTKINELIDLLDRFGIKVGLVTNGTLFKRFNLDNINKVTWCRISISDEYKPKLDFLEEVVQNKTDWSFSYVVTKQFNKNKLFETINFANKHNFTHVRIVNDILSGCEDGLMETIKQLLKDNNIDDSKVIYQGRKTFSRGAKRCLIGLMKPNISPDGMITSCCGIQYAINPPPLDFNKKFAIGYVEDIEHIWKNQKYFEGTFCSKCYYSDYNNILNILWDSNEIQHQEFI